jgi:hypothetical protein
VIEDPAEPEALVLGCLDARARLRIAGRTAPLPPRARVEIGGHLRHATEHCRLATLRPQFGEQRPVTYTRVQLPAPTIERLSHEVDHFPGSHHQASVVSPSGSPAISPVCSRPWALTESRSRRRRTTRRMPYSGSPVRPRWPWVSYCAGDLTTSGAALMLAQHVGCASISDGNRPQVSPRRLADENPGQLTTGRCRQDRERQ